VRRHHARPPHQHGVLQARRAAAGARCAATARRQSGGAVQQRPALRSQLRGRRTRAAPAASDAAARRCRRAAAAGAQQQPCCCDGPAAAPYGTAQRTRMCSACCVPLASRCSGAVTRPPAACHMRRTPTTARCPALLRAGLLPCSVAHQGGRGRPRALQRQLQGHAGALVCARACAWDTLPAASWRMTRRGCSGGRGISAHVSAPMTCLNTTVAGARAAPGGRLLCVRAV
jgi:hypothetical protein